MNVISGRVSFMKIGLLPARVHRNRQQKLYVQWNEAANLANLHKLRIRIFTLDTLPEEDKWYLDEFAKISVGEGYLARTRSSFESRASSAHEESRPSSCSAHRVEASLMNCGGFGSFSDHHHGEEVEQDPSHPLNSLQKHISTLRSCLTQSVRSPTKKVPPVAQEEIAVQCHDDSEQKCQADLHLQGSVQQFSMKQVKIEEEDDEVQILFSGRLEYLEALHRERCRE
ncbi:hypothetical protein GCK32_003669 [Trichostrongylus colubriformis]|uniref:Uncharacterized protein n=1 Tax=Trichostrongylus colubriformis TaxID=6319 RepID=A0AAN8F4V4_TRICO